jgi:uncharacterized protein (DUF2249 family)
MTEFIDLDVGPILQAGTDPFSAIMATLERLEPGQGLRLYAPFKPVPLFGVMAKKGFAHQEDELGGGNWEVRFSPVGADQIWPEPVIDIDNRELDPLQSTVKILAVIEQLAPGQTLSALLAREPVVLFRDLEQRGHQWRGGFTQEGDTYQLTIRVGA